MICIINNFIHLKNVTYIGETIPTIIAIKIIRLIKQLQFSCYSSSLWFPFSYIFAFSTSVSF